MVVRRRTRLREWFRRYRKTAAGKSLIAIIGGTIIIGGLAFRLPLSYEADCVPVDALKDGADANCPTLPGANSEASTDENPEASKNEDPQTLESDYRNRLPALDSGSLIWYAGGTWLLAAISMWTLGSLLDSYNRSKRVESARLTKDFYERWFFDAQLVKFRSYLENEDWWHLPQDAHAELRSTVCRSNTSCSHADPNPISRVGDLDFVGNRGSTCEHDREKLAVLDTGLNFLELMLKLREEDTIEAGHLDSFSFYWVDSLMRLPDRFLLRRYVFRWGWQRIQDRLSRQDVTSYFRDVALIKPADEQPNSLDRDGEGKAKEPFINKWEEVHERPKPTRGSYLELKQPPSCLAARQAQPPPHRRLEPPWA